MEAAAILMGIMGVLSYFSELPSFDESKRILEGETEYFSARMQDIKRELKISSNGVKLGRKRKRDDCQWMTEGEMLVEKSRRVLSHVADVRGWRSLFMGLTMRWSVYKLTCALKFHDRIMGGLNLRKTLSDSPSLCNEHIPVNHVVGQLASKSLDRLKLLLDGDKTARIAICGMQGIGKTFLMKHLYNYACSLDCFNYVFWVSCPDKFTIKGMQDAVAEVVKCNIATDDDLFVRASKLSGAFAKLGSFALFLDGVSKADFFLEHVGIPVPVQGSKCKLVLTTSSVLESRLLNCFERIEIQRLPKEDAYELFMRKANIGKESVSSLDGIPFLLADRCYGVPRMIENMATPLCNIDDPCEWRYALVRKP